MCRLVVQPPCLARNSTLDKCGEDVFLSSGSIPYRHSLLSKSLQESRLHDSGDRLSLSGRDAAVKTKGYSVQHGYLTGIHFGLAYETADVRSVRDGTTLLVRRWSRSSAALDGVREELDVQSKKSFRQLLWVASLSLWLYGVQ